jgi:hypothetical protein
MKQLLIPAIIIAICSFGCKDKAMVKSSSETALPMPLAYAGKPEIGSEENMINVMKWNKYLGNNQPDSAFALVADSLTVNLHDGSTMDGPKDSLKAGLMQMLSQMKSIVIDYIAAVPVNNTDKGDEWVLSWTDEQYFYKNGRREHNILHEDYRLVKGKIREINQYARMVKEDATPK